MNLQIIAVGNCAIFIVASQPGYSLVDEMASDVYTKIASVLRGRCAFIVHERIFGSLSSEREIMISRKLALKKFDIPSEGPVTYIEGAPPSGPGFAGVIIRAIVPQNIDDVWTIMDDSIPCGCGWRRNGVTFLQLQNIQAISHPSIHHHPTSPIKGQESDNFPPATKAWAVIANADRILRAQGASYRDVVRTWFYLSDILDWYADFNHVRNIKYREFGIMPVPGAERILLPASTGVGARNTQRSALTMDLFAVAGPAEIRPIVRR